MRTCMRRDVGMLVGATHLRSSLRSFYGFERDNNAKLGVETGKYLFFPNFMDILSRFFDSHWRSSAHSLDFRSSLNTAESSSTINDQKPIILHVNTQKLRCIQLSL